jgi:hypothetical protein
VDAGYRGRGRKWAEEVLGLSVEVVRKPPKPVPEKVARTWAEEWTKEGKEVDWQRLMPPKGFRVLPRRWVVERTYAWISPWISHNPASNGQGLREVVCYWGGLCLRGDDAADGEEVGPYVGVSRQSLSAPR